MDAEDFLPMPREEFDRLPMDVQARTLEKIRQQRAFRDACADVRRKRIPMGAALGAVCALILSPSVAFSLPFACVVTVGGALLGALFVHKQLNHILGIVLFGSLGIGASIIAYVAGWLNTSQTLFMFFGWIFYCLAGGLISYWACAELPETRRPSA